MSLKRKQIRRQEIVDTTLALLSELPLEQVTTRRIARALDLSQPALFRHFASRSDLLEAVLEQTREHIASVAQDVLTAPGGPKESLRALAQALFEYVEAHPGLPRLLFGHVAEPDPNLQVRFRLLVSMQNNLVQALYAEGAHRGQFQADLEPRDVAASFVGLIQGFVFQWELEGRREPLAPRARTLFELWLRGVQGEPSPSEPAKKDAGRPTDGLRLATVDVRPILSRGTDPLAQILSALEGLPAGAVLEIVAPFKPVPLLALLSSQGHSTVERRHGSMWIVDVVVAGSPTITALDDRPAPEPLVAIMSACAELAPGQVFLARVPQNPRLVLPKLEERGLSYDVLESLDGSALVCVWRPR